MLIDGYLLGFAAAAMLQSSDAARVDQISVSAAVVPADIPQPPTPEAPGQLTPISQSKSPARQVSDGSRSAAPPQQLAPKRRSAQAATPLSKPADGRPSPAERIGGADRCDPSRAKRPPSRCFQVIENRAAEFNRNEAPELSPEQKISLEHAGVDTTGIDAATRQLATTGNDGGSMDAQGVAAIVLGRPAEPKKPEPELDPAQAEAAAAAGAILNPGPPQ